MFAMFNQLFASITSLFRAFGHGAGALEHLASAGETQAAVYSTKTKLGCEAELIEATAALDRIRANNAKAASAVSAANALAPAAIPAPSVAKPVAKRGPKAKSKPVAQ